MQPKKRHLRGSEPFFMSERGRRGCCSHPLGPNRRDSLKVTYSTDHSPHRACELCSGNLDIGGLTGYLVHNNGQVTVFPPGYNRGASLSRPDLSLLSPPVHFLEHSSLNHSPPPQYSTTLDRSFLLPHNQVIRLGGAQPLPNCETPSPSHCPMALKGLWLAVL